MSIGIKQQIAELAEEARSECIRLLASASFTLDRGVHVRGKLVSVAISVLRNPVDQQCRIQVACHTAGHLKVEWDRVPLFLVDADSNKDLDRDVLGSRGRSKVFHVPYGPRTLLFQDPGVILIELEEKYLVGHGGLADSFDKEVFSKDGRLKAKACIKEGPTLHIDVDALDESLRGASVTFEIRSMRTGTVLHSSPPIPLQYESGLRGEWVFAAELPKGEDFELSVRLLSDK